MASVATANVNEPASGNITILSALATTGSRPLAASDITNASTQFYWDPAQGGNGHIYEYVGDSTSWDQAASLVASRSLAGVQGHLATVTTHSELAAVWGAFGTLYNGSERGIPWVAASDSADEGVWRWVAGPEAGQLVDPSLWAAGEPNNFGEEDYAVLHWQRGNGLFFDYPTSLNQAYLVEYSGAVSSDTPAVPATTGDFLEGRELFADTSLITDANGIGAVSLTWQRSIDGGLTWIDIPGAIGASYILVQADVGNLVRVSGSYTNGSGTLETITSAPSSAIINVNDAPVITSDGGGSTASIAVSENTTAVTTVTGTDPDANTILSYSISGGADAALFQHSAPAAPHAPNIACRGFAQGCLDPVWVMHQVQHAAGLCRLLQPPAPAS
jgi:hypothetical protein